MPSLAAERMRRHRQRQRKGLRCLRIELHEMEIDGAICKGLLRSETRNDQKCNCQCDSMHFLIAL